jgi:transposase
MRIVDIRELSVPISRYADPSADESLPVLARELFAAQAKEYAQLLAQIDEVDARLMLGIAPMNAADGSPRYPASARSARCC